jgi:prefoldin subunit 5
MMSEDRTQNLPNDELRQILAQLTSINARLDGMDARLESLEARDYDTKPIWENAFKEIADLRVEMREGFTKVDAEFTGVHTGMDKLRGELGTGMRTVAKQIDVMHRSILEVQAELRFMDDRVTKLEPQTAQ